MSTLFAKNGFSRPSLEQLCGVFRHVLGLRLLIPPKTFVPAGQGRLRQLLHRTKKIGLYFRGVNGPPLQTTIIMVKASCKYCCQTPFSEGNTRRLLEKEYRFFCVRCISKKLSLSCGKTKTMRPHSERGYYLSKLLCSLAPRKHSAKLY